MIGIRKETMRGSGAVGDPFWANVVLLLQPTGAIGQTTFVNQKTGAALTRTGDVVTVAQSPVGGISAYFDGNGDFLSSSVTNLNFGGGDWTVDAWLNLQAYNTQYTAILRSANPSGELGLTGSGVLDIGISGDFYSGALGSTGVSLNAWTHIAWVRSGSTVTAYTGGVARGSFGVAGKLFNFSSGGYNIGRVHNGISNAAPYFPTMYLPVIRATGAARYTTNFTPPTCPFPTF